MRGLAEAAFADTRSIAVVAVGGYGRGALSPHSDIDLWLIHPPRTRVPQEVLRRFLYPLWDSGFQVGHALGTPKDLVERARWDLHATTSLLSARLVTGDSDLFAELLGRRDGWMAKNSKQVVRRIMETTAERHRSADRAGWALAPDLKEDIGGLRDLHVATWLGAWAAGAPLDPELVQAGEVLLAVREALHAESRRRNDRVRVHLQPVLAHRLGFEGSNAADELMTEVHSSARVIEHGAAAVSDAVSARVLGGPRRSGEVRHLDLGVRVEDGVLVGTRDPGSDRLAHAVRLLAARAETGRPVAPPSLAWLKSSFDGQMPSRWSDEMRAAFLELLRARDAPAALELLDHVGGWRGMLPEWAGIRGRAQHDLYHRYTVDGHSFLTVAEISRAVVADRVAMLAAQEAGDLDTLYLAALLHDIGKGSGEDHRVAGERLARAACQRMGLSEKEVDEVAALVRQHLLLADTATRRDLDDGAVISGVAETIGDARMLHLLYILSVADGRATGPGGWSDWKGALVLELYRKALVAIATGEAPLRADVSARAREIEAYEPRLAGRAEAVLSTLPPSYLESASVDVMADELPLLIHPPGFGEVRYRMDDHTVGGRIALTLCAADRRGTLARAAGVLALNRISILRAQAYSTSSGLALERFVVVAPPEASWKRLSDDLSAAFSGRLALEARLERKARDYLPSTPVEADIRVLQDASAHSTIVEVRAPDALGLLYAIAAGLSDLDLDIHVAKIDTLGERVVDVFYVRTLCGAKLHDEQIPEVERAIRYRLERILGAGSR